MTYAPLEPTIANELGVQLPSFSGATASLYDVSVFAWTLSLTVIGLAVLYRLLVAGGYRMQASESSIRKSNEVAKKAVFGFLGVFGMFILLITLNKDLVTGDVRLADLAVKGGGQSGGLDLVTPSKAQTSSGQSTSCEASASVISSLQSTSGLCGNTSCTILSGCNYQAFLPIISQVAGGNIDLQKMAVVTLCKESRGDPNAERRNDNGTYDCGLMQINQPTKCDQSSFSVEENIKKGVTKLQQLNNSSVNAEIYPNIPKKGGVFASYNCCANGTIPNAHSDDCTQSAGFPYTLPKWACPINPGTGTFNMCSVKKYVCDLDACFAQLQL